QEQGISGTVVCQLMIDRYGNIVQASIVKSAHPLLEKAVLRVVHLMPQWKPLPYTGDGEPMAVSIPVTFRLQGR
ncbi:MAG: energy transducer TonB, partial [Oxalobacter sp.]|nr:energy transducer TonB [Oxalobacter sp.]